MFTSTGGMGPECLRFHSRLAELIADKKGEHYSRTISWIRARTFFALLRSTKFRGSHFINIFIEYIYTYFYFYSFLFIGNRFLDL